MLSRNLVGALRAEGFFEIPARAVWINRDRRISFSHEVIRDHDAAWLKARSREEVPEGEFHFISVRPLPPEVSSAILQQLDLLHLRPVTGDQKRLTADVARLTLPRGGALRRALADRGISTAGLPVSAMGTPMEAALQGRLLEVLRLEHKVEMAKTTARIETVASLPATRAIRILRIVREDGAELLKTRPLDMNEVQAWEATIHEILIQGFGSASNNVSKFAQVGRARYPKVDSTAGWEEVRIDNLTERLSLVGSCIKQLELVRGEDEREPSVSAPRPQGNRIFIGHGGDLTWLVVKDFLVDRLQLHYEEFNREAAAGIPTAERLQTMLDESAFALIVMTGEDERGDGKRHARENVIHELGLFQGRLGYRRAIILLEDGCEAFSNIEGVTQLRFRKGDVRATFEEIRRTIERERADLLVKSA